MAQQPIVQLRSLAGNNLAIAGVQVTVGIAPEGATLSGTTTVATDGNGRATFTDLAITGAPGEYTLSFSALGYTEVTSDPVTLVAAP